MLHVSHRCFSLFLSCSSLSLSLVSFFLSPPSTTILPCAHDFGSSTALLIIPGNKYMRWELVSFFSGFFSIIAINARNVPQKFLPCLFSSPCNCFHFIPQCLLRCLLFCIYMSWPLVSSCVSCSNSIIPIEHTSAVTPLVSSCFLYLQLLFSVCLLVTLVSSSLSLREVTFC